MNTTSELAYLNGELSLLTQDISLLTKDICTLTDKLDSLNNKIHVLEKEIKVEEQVPYTNLQPIWVRFSLTDKWYLRYFIGYTKNRRVITTQYKNSLDSKYTYTWSYHMPVINPNIGE